VVLAFVTSNCCEALLEIGDWDRCASLSSQDTAPEGVAHDLALLIQARLAALRGDGATATSLTDRLAHLADSDEAQWRAHLRLTAAYIASAEGDHATALAIAKDVTSIAKAGGMYVDFAGWTWPLAARSAFELDDDEEGGMLLADLDASATGHSTQMLSGERALALARLAARRGDPSARDQFAAGIADQRHRPSPYHLAHGLLDFATYLHSSGRPEDAEPLIEEAAGIADRLGAEPLVRRVADVRSTVRV
jgi:ATP/maltotriose-dependent transcriptional regulator MalT